MIDSESSAGGLFGAISWPVSRFALAEGLLLEQQMFLPHDGSAVALSWALRDDAVASAHLAVRPFFSGCGPRFYRDVGFRFDSDENGGRMTWLPNVRGPKISADTNGRYHDEPVRLFDCLCEQTAASALEEDLVTPGRFEFELGRRPSVLIFSIEGLANAQRDQHVGVFLAGLMQENSPARSGRPLLRTLVRQLSSLQPHDQLSNIFRHRDGLGETNQSGVAILIAQQSENQPSAPSGLSKV